MLIPRFLPNGAEIIKLSYSALTNDGVVLARLEKACHNQYVTWRFESNNLASTYSGNYYGSPESDGNLDLLDAQIDFRARS